jgi:phage terminase small subunit
MPKGKLTNKQRLFIREYLIDLNATQAAKRAGYSNRTAFTIGAENLKKPLIKAAIREHLDKKTSKLEISIDKTLTRLMQGQEFDVRKMYHPNGKLKKPHELDDDTARAVVGIKYDAKGHLEYKIIDVKGCCELIGKYQGLFADTVKHSVDENDPLYKLLSNIDGKTKGLPEPPE